MNGPAIWTHCATRLANNKQENDYGERNQNPASIAPGRLCTIASNPARPWHQRLGMVAGSEGRQVSAAGQAGGAHNGLAGGGDKRTDSTHVGEI